MKSVLPVPCGFVNVRCRFPRFSCRWIKNQWNFGTLQVSANLEELSPINYRRIMKFGQTNSCQHYWCDHPYSFVWRVWRRATLRLKQPDRRKVSQIQTVYERGNSLWIFEKDLCPFFLTLKRKWLCCIFSGMKAKGSKRAKSRTEHDCFPSC